MFTRMFHSDRKVMDIVDADIKTFRKRRSRNPVEKLSLLVFNGQKTLFSHRFLLHLEHDKFILCKRIQLFDIIL